MEIYESESGLIDKDFTTSRRNKAYYYYKGFLYLVKENLDSAEFFFRKEIQSAVETNDLEIGYKGLLSVYKKKHLTDSIEKYALLSCDMNDNYYKDAATQNYQRLQSVYNYSHQQRIAQMMERRAKRIQTWLVVLLTIFLIVATIVFFKVRENQKEKARNEDELRKTIDRLEDEKKDLSILRSLDKEKLLEATTDKERIVLQLNKEIIVLQNKVGRKNAAEAEMRINDNVFVCDLKQKPRTLNSYEWKILRSVIQKEMPVFLPTLHGCCLNLLDYEVDLCILIRMNFTMKAISVIIDKDLQFLSRTRRRLLEKVFQKGGGAKDFDKLIKQIG